MPTSFWNPSSQRGSHPSVTAPPPQGGAPAAHDLFGRESRRARLRVAERSMCGMGVTGIVLGWATPTEGVLSGGDGSRAVVALLAALVGCLVGWGGGWLATFLWQAARRVVPHRHS